MLSLRERWFGEITRKRIRYGVFHSFPAFIAAIGECVKLNNRNMKPFVWTRRVDQIIEKINHCKGTVETLP